MNAVSCEQTFNKRMLLSAAMVLSFCLIIPNLACSGSSGSSAPQNAAPAITSQPASQTVVKNSTATFTVSASGTPAPTYQWRKGGATVAGQTSASLVISNAQTSDEGSYDVVVTNSVGSVNSIAATLTVEYAPAFTAHPGNQTVIAPSQGGFNVVVDAKPIATYQWQSSPSGTTWTDISGATSITYSTGATTGAMNNTQFRCVATNTRGSATSNPATLHVNVPDASLVAYYSFNGNVNDATGTNNGTLVGTTLTSDRNGNANSALNTNSGYLQVAHNTSLNLNNFTVSAWFKMEAVGSAFNCLVGKDYTSALAFGVNSGGSGACPAPPGTARKIILYINNVSHVFNLSDISCNIWYHVSVTYNNSTGAVQLYLNGALADSGSMPAGGMVFNTYPLGIGQDGHYGDHFTGRIDEVYIYNRVLTASEILALYLM